MSVLVCLPMSPPPAAPRVRRCSEQPPGRGALPLVGRAVATPARFPPLPRFVYALPVLLAALLVGCASDSHDLSLPQNRALRDCINAANAMRAGEYDRAKAELDDALPLMGGIIANDADARRARRLFFGEEAGKTFIGEPYERVMAFYYRGILYWRDGELDNARACFRSAQFQDADVEHHEYASDYVLLDYLDGYLTAKLGGDGSDMLARARTNARGSSPPPYHVPANVMCFIEFNHGPVKFAAGNYGELLRVRPGGGDVQSVTVRLAEQQFPLVPYDDLFFQASTRGGREMDHILAGKAVFKGTTDTLGTAAIFSGIGLAAADKGEAGAIVAGAGVLTKLIAAAVTPDADTRVWYNLPQFLTFAALQLPPGSHTVMVDFKSATGQTLLTREATFSVSESGRDVVLFFSSIP